MKPHDDFSDIRALLARKRSELPSDDYFRTVLPEFHRRQRAELLQPKSPLAIWWNDLAETIASSLQAAPAVRYAAAAVIAILCCVAAIQMQNHSGPAEVAQTPAPPAQLYAFSQALDSRYLSKIDQTIDAASVGSANSGAKAPHYVLANTPASYDATMAF